MRNCHFTFFLKTWKTSFIGLFSSNYTWASLFSYRIDHNLLRILIMNLRILFPGEYPFLSFNLRKLQAIFQDLRWNIWIVRMSIIFLNNTLRRRSTSLQNNICRINYDMFLVWKCYLNRKILEFRILLGDVISFENHINMGLSGRIHRGDWSNKVKNQ